ncbi:DJ-1/PfpI family protein [Bacillus sp. MMSF_3353]|uniref:DJ-1/PfpI family protein n=1 Tax=Bacillus sp. MMSF_3353 TaxID=3047081 RepID=UPI00273EAD9C|nr:DJ-1/PfpI family protein [Bacillus sp. MMSF_3353]
MKKALFLIYDGYAEFEINILSFFLKDKGFYIETVGVSDDPYIEGESGFFTVPKLKLGEVEVSQYDILIIPGGNIFPLLNNQKLLDLIKEFRYENKWIAGICSASALLGASGVLNNIKFSTSLNSKVKEVENLHDWTKKQLNCVTVDSRIITATGSAYVEFAVVVLKVLGYLDSYEEEKETILYYKNLILEY